MPVGVYARLSGDQMKARLGKLKAAQAMPLAHKVSHAKGVIDAAAAHGQVGIMFSGGRDSCAVALLARHHSPVLIYCDTGLSSAGATRRVKAVADSLGLPLNILTPDAPAFEMWQKLGHYPIGPKRGHTYLKAKTGISTSPVQCCYNLKEKPAKAFIRKMKLGVILWGNRASDSNRRKLGIADHGMMQPPSDRWPCWSAQPVALFTDADIAATVAGINHRFIDRGEDGCQVCCTDLARKDNQLTRCFVTNRKAFDEAITCGLGAQILKARGEPHTPADVATAMAEKPHAFLRIPAVGKKGMMNANRHD